MNLHSKAWCHILRTNEASTENKTNKNTNHHLSQLRAKKTQKKPSSPPQQWQRTGGLADVRGGGGAENVLIGGPVKQLGERILAGLWPISLESVLRRHLSVVTTSPLLRNRRKRMQPRKGIFLLQAHVPHYSSTPSLALQWRGQLSYVCTFVHPCLFLFVHVPPKLLCLVAPLSLSTPCLANDWLLRMRRIKSGHMCY